MRHHRDVHHVAPPTGGPPPELRELYVTRTHMITLHRALLEGLIMGTPPVLWQLGCLHHSVHPPSLAHTGSYPVLSIFATTSLTKGQPWRPERSTFVDPPLSTEILPRGTTYQKSPKLRYSLLPHPPVALLTPGLYRRHMASPRCGQRYRIPSTQHSRNQTLPWSPLGVDKDRPL